MSENQEQATNNTNKPVQPWKTRKLGEPIETVGIFYETEDGTIVDTYGWNKGLLLCSKWTENEQERTFEIYFADTKQWKERSDLNKFPQDPNDRLPYVFDLFWNIKTVYELIMNFGERQHDPLFRKHVKQNRETIVKSIEAMRASGLKMYEDIYDSHFGIPDLLKKILKIS